MPYQGLSSSQAKEKLAAVGLNKLPDKDKQSLFILFLSQFNNFLIYLLLIAAILSFTIGDKVDGFLIALILVLNAALGFWQEYKASKELEALRKFEVADARVIRDGIQVEIPSYEIVPGDVVVLEAGDEIPADGVFIEAFNISVNESSLTGESQPVTKSLEKDDNLGYFGTSLASGKGLLEITLTGGQTKFGKVALTLSEVREEVTPLEKAINDLSIKVGVVAFIAALILFILRIYQKQPIFEVFFSSIALLVAAVPEGFPAIITAILTFGVRNMYRHKTLVRKLSSVESLGTTDVICIDKTGTLTKNQMTVSKTEIEKDQLPEALKCAALCNTASLVIKENGYEVLGDTTEGALLVWVGKEGFNVDEYKNKGKVIEEIPFDSERRMMSVLWQETGTKILVQYTKGAPEKILGLSKISEIKKHKVLDEYNKMSKNGLRVLALAKKLPGTSKKISEDNLEFLGLIGISDEPRLEAKDAIIEARKAGIEIVMVTGDNALTSAYIASKVGLMKPEDEILTGDQLDSLNDEELLKILPKIRIFARALPEHKYRIVKAYQSLGKVVAVTGDGVNDALALKQAHVGISMGITGTDVAKEASDMVILDDNLATIVKAVEEGRRIYANILKVVKFLMIGNLSEVILVLSVALMDYPTPLLPVQLLWINFVTDGLPALSLAFDKGHSNLMNEPPRDKSNRAFLNLNRLYFVIISGLLIGVLNLALFIVLFDLYGLNTARSITFPFMVVSQMIMLFVLRGRNLLFSNKYLLLSVGFVLLLQGIISYWEPVSKLFKL